MAVTTPTILVKKADGSQVRMTMAEFLVYKKSLNHLTTLPPDHSTDSTFDDDDEIMDDDIDDVEEPETDDMSTSEDEIEENSKEIESNVTQVFRPDGGQSAKDTKVELHNLPMIEESMALSTSAPVKDIFVDEAKYNGIRNTKRYDLPAGRQELRNELLVVEDKNIDTKTGDKKYEIEEDEEINKQTDYPVLPSRRGDVLDEILPKLSFEVSPDLYSRLNSLVISRLKDVRSDGQIAEYAVRAIDKGGLALNEDQAVELVNVIAQSAGDTKYPFDKLRAGEKHEITKVEEKKVESLENEKINLGEEMESEPFPITPQPSHVAMHDVVMPVAVTPVKTEADRTTSPIDELEQFTLTDFRRLNSKPAEAGKILAEKIKNLHQESYEQFTQGLKAWYNSPLYRQYQNVIQRAIENNQKIDEVLSEGNRDELTKEEFNQLALGLKI